MPSYSVIDAEPDRKRIRIGLAFLTLVVAVALVMAFVVEAPAGKLVMVVIAAFTVLRTFSMVRGIKRAR